MISLPNCVSLSGDDRFPILEIDHPNCRAKVSLHGAQLLSWSPSGHADVLFTSSSAIMRSGVAIRGGIPICWPWFGAGVKKEMPSHGFARLNNWELVKCTAWANDVMLVFELRPTKETRQFFNYDYVLQAKIRLGSDLIFHLRTWNVGYREFRISEALHSYFRVTNAENIEIAGLEKISYLDRVSNSEKSIRQDGTVKISGEVDRIYESKNRVSLHDEGRIITIDKWGSDSTVVWNPGVEKAGRLNDLASGEEKNFVCIETANAAGGSICIPPGMDHVIGMRIQAKTLS